MSVPFLVVIPARFASSRLPGKPLQLIAGKPMIEHVWRQATSSSASRVVVATDDARIVQACEAFGAEALLTRPDHESGTDRLAEVADQLALPDDTIVVNVQGDEPMIPPAVIDQVAQNLASNPQAAIATLAEPLREAESLFNPNVVKVLSDKAGLALAFSRAPLPWARDQFAADRDCLPEGVPYRRHIGIYAYRARLLRQFVAWGSCWLEETERLEQLRALWHGERIHVADAVSPLPAGIDTPDDLERVRRLLGH
ncbi:3-deoxy-manno-octulosonate cytidylyltransferase [Stutzerimonas urumqiensis]|uniref:3-deoxy-manno-octulosonate cytidylyltransferase n=1 Tax=Stutzerimonas urumqiensis TaxID=638269 RepID=UPI000EB3B040|nr:3-deoxy-manno-octulosonate cytidylyltransferase [Stutzerimonas urumqiensis]